VPNVPIYTGCGYDLYLDCQRTPVLHIHVMLFQYFASAYMHIRHLCNPPSENPGYTCTMIMPTVCLGYHRGTAALYMLQLA